MNRQETQELLATIYAISPTNKLTNPADRARAEEIWILSMQDVPFADAMNRVSEFYRTHPSSQSLTPMNVLPEKKPPREIGASSPAAGSDEWKDGECNPIIVSDLHTTSGDMTSEDDQQQGDAHREAVAEGHRRPAGRTVWCKRCNTEQTYDSEQEAQHAAATHQFVPWEDRPHKAAVVPRGRAVVGIVDRLAREQGTE